MSYKTNVLITKEDDWYVASSVETNVVSQGHTIEEALENLKEALELYYEDNSNINVENNVCLMTSLEVTI
ncbi:MAG: type II toxin-antitoxin system HicB family antitoxin [Lachnospiraceae bacterium]|jgi:predicted RNase H-like HicB family nuclease|nr:type II toxin-antitoxin system HicB family antitoxin [Lachnospiraceae bacterium]